MNIQTDITLAVFQSVKTVGGEGGWGERFKRPIDFRESESVTSPFCEGESLGSIKSPLTRETSLFRT